MFNLQLILCLSPWSTANHAASGKVLEASPVVPVEQLKIGVVSDELQEVSHQEPSGGLGESARKLFTPHIHTLYFLSFLPDECFQFWWRVRIRYSALQQIPRFLACPPPVPPLVWRTGAFGRRGATPTIACWPRVSFSSGRRRAARPGYWHKAPDGSWRNEETGKAAYPR